MIFCLKQVLFFGIFALILAGQDVPEWFESMCRSTYHASSYGQRRGGGGGGGYFRRGFGSRDARKGTDRGETYHARPGGSFEPPPGFGSNGGSYDDRW